MNDINAAKARVSVLVATVGIALLIGVASSRGADPEGRGSTNSTISLLRVSVNGTQADIGTGSGMSSNEAGSLSARTDFLAAQALDLTLGEISATADEANPGGSVFDEFLPFDVESLVEGSVTYSGAEARVDSDDQWAWATLGHATLDATFADGLVRVSGVEIGSTNESTPSTAEAIEGLSIAKLDVVNLSIFLNRATEASADDFLALAEHLGGDAVTTPVASVESARNQAIDEISTLLPLGTSLPGDPSAGYILQFAEDCPSVPVLALVCDQIQNAAAPLQSAVDDLELTLGSVPLVSINALQLGVSATTANGVATASAIADWGTASVAGVELMEVVDPAEAMDLLVAAVEQAELELRKVPGLEGLEIDVQPLVTSTPAGTSGATQAAESQLDFLEIAITSPATSTVPAPLAVGVDVITMAASSNYRTASGESDEGENDDGEIEDEDVDTEVSGEVLDIEQPRGSSDDDPESSGGFGGGGPVLASPRCSMTCEGLAKTGLDLRWAAVGMLLFVMGAQLRRWVHQEA